MKRLSAHSPQARPLPRRFRPVVEALEDRCLPSVGIFDPATGTWYLRASNTLGPPDSGPFAYGAPGWSPVSGDWSGSGSPGIGVFDPATAAWYLKNDPEAGAPDTAPFAYGGPGWIPVVGDWNGDGTTTVGVVDPSTMTWYLKNSNSAGAPDYAPFRFGAPGWIPVVGDWTGSGKTGIGVFDPGTATWYLRNSISPGAPDIGPFAYGGPGWQPVVGDWDGDGVATIGVVDPAANWYVRNRNSPGAPDLQPFAYGAGPWAPVSLPLSPLAGAKDFSGPYPSPTTVTFTDRSNQRQQVLAIPGQVQVIFGHSTGPSAAASAIQADGGSILARIPRLGVYLVGVQAGQEGAFISRAEADARVLYVAPNAVASLDDSTVIDNFNSNPQGGGFPGGASSHGQWVENVLTAERGLGAAPGGVIDNPSSAVWSPSSATAGLVGGLVTRAIENAAVGSLGGPNYLNISANGSSGEGWYTFVAGLVATVAQLPPIFRQNLVITVAAGNEDLNLDPLLARLRQDPVSGPTLSRVLSSNFLIVTASHSVFSKADTTSGDPSVAVMTNPDARFGTSGAAPAANGRIQRVAHDAGVSAAVALQAAKRAIMKNPNHDLVISEALAQVAAAQDGVQAGQLFAGSYAGSYEGTGSAFGYQAPANGSVHFTVDDGGLITVTDPGGGTGAVALSGSASFGAAGGGGSALGATYSFSGQFTFLSPSGGVSASGSWTAGVLGGTAAGGWSATRL